MLCLALWDPHQYFIILFLDTPSILSVYRLCSHISFLLFVKIISRITRYDQILLNATKSEITMTKLLLVLTRSLKVVHFIHIDRRTGFLIGMYINR